MTENEEQNEEKLDENLIIGSTVFIKNSKKEVEEK